MGRFAGAFAQSLASSCRQTFAVLQQICRLTPKMPAAQKHLTTGDAFPAHLANNASAGDSTKLVLLSMRFCPFAHRAHLMLERKQLPYDVVNIHLQQKPTWLTDFSRQGKVPALGLRNEPGQPFLYESLLITDYLDEKYGQTLYPKDPLLKALDRLWIERFVGSVAPAFYKMAFHGAAGAVPADGAEKLAEAFGPFEEELGRRGTSFFGGAEQPGMLDYMIWPWVERVAALALLPEAGGRFVLGEAFAKLGAWQEAMKRDEAVAKWWLSAEVHSEFMRSYNAGKPNYDMLVEKEEAAA